MILDWCDPGLWGFQMYIYDNFYIANKVLRWRGQQLVPVRDIQAQTQGNTSWLQWDNILWEILFWKILASWLCKYISQIISFHLLIFQWEVVKCMPDWWYDYMVVIHFSACYEHANVFWELRTNQACGKGHGPPHCKLSNNKDCCCAADFCAAPRNSRAETTKFRKRLKHVERGSHVEGLRRNSLNLQFQRFSISIDVMHISIDGC